MTRTPTARRRYCSSTPASESPIVKAWTMSAPSSVPTTPPRPPNRLVPPMTTAVMLSRLASVIALGLAAPARPMRTHAARP